MRLEDKKQADFVLWFGQTYPQFRQMLISINNNSINQKTAMYNRAMGLSKSAPDLLLLLNGIVLGIELKVKESKHKKIHIISQLLFGKQMIKHGFYYIMTYNTQFLKEIIEKILNNSFNSYELNKKLEKDINFYSQIKTKTVKIY